MVKYKKITSGITLTVLLISLLWLLITNLFLTNYHLDWQSQPYNVTKIIDGDTIEVMGAYETFRVRYIGMNTPETEKPGQKLECYANEAKYRNEELISESDIKFILNQIKEIEINTIGNLDMFMLKKRINLK